MRFPAILLACIAWLSLSIGTMMLCHMQPAHARSQMSLIRDAEIENTIHAFAAPLMRTAGLDPKALRIHLIDDPSLNAFVTHGMNLFLHTGLLTNADDASQVIGVMAHEIGHITGGHVTQRSQQISRTQEKLWISYLMGAAAALATGRGDAMAGATLAAQSAMLENLMKFSRAEENQADQAGVEYLDSIGMSSEGLLAFMKKLQGQELLVTARQDPYLRTHPLTRDRVAFMRNHVEQSGLPKDTVPPAWKVAFKRLQAKLHGFLDNPGTSLQRYPENVTKPDAVYGRAIALYKLGETQKAITLLDSLLKGAPNDPYYLELKGQILFESGDPDGSIAPYRASVKNAPYDGPLYYGLVRALIARGEQGDYNEAETVMTQGLRLEPDNASYWKQLAIAQGRNNKIANADYSMAEYSIRTRQYAKAKHHAGRAVRTLKKGIPRHLRAQDIEAEAMHQLELKRKRKSNR